MTRKRRVIGQQPQSGRSPEFGEPGGADPVRSGDTGLAPSDPVVLDPTSSLLSVLLRSSIDGIAVFSAVHDDDLIVDFEFVTLSASAERLLRRSAIELVGTRLSHFSPQIPGDRLARYGDVVATGTAWTTRVQWHDSEGRWFDIAAAPFASHGLVLIFRDVTDRMSTEELMEEFQRRQRVLERQALHDPLTSTANRVLVDSRLEHALSRLARTGASLAVLFIDLDGFKSINDSHGHAAGDAVLIEIAARLRSAARSADTVGRIGGDEFVVVCEDLDDAWDIDRIAHRLLSVCRAPIAIGENRLVVTASVGVAIADSSAIDPVALVHEADTAMYRAKSEGGDRVEYANDAVHEQTLIRHDVEVGLHRALTEEALHVEFDEVRAADGNAIAQLVRLGWLHPEHGLVDASTLADAADAVGLVAALTEWVIDRALAQLAGWLATPTDPPRFVVVDVDYQALRDTGFADRLVSHLARHGCDPRVLCIALDGGHLTAHLEEVKPVLERLADIGVRIARNGVGAAGSSLTYLRGLPIDMVVLDDALTDDPGSPNELLRLVIDVAKGGNRVVIAPASEPDHRAFLYALGVDLLYDSPSE